jgi:hypothetical protein
MTLTEKRHGLLVQKMKLDKFFSLYLEKFERKMDPDKPDTPIWKLYKAKLKEYGALNQEIKNTEYWIAKERNV